MKESKAVYVTKTDLKVETNKEYSNYASTTIRDRDLSPGSTRYEQNTQEVACQFDSKRDNLICTCRNLATLKKRQEVRYFGLPKQIYAYHGSRSFTDIGVGSVKALQRKKVKKIYLPETDDRGVGSSELSSYLLRRNRQHRVNSYYENKRTSSKCVGGILEYNTGCVMNEKLSPIVHTISGSTSPRGSILNRNIEIGSNLVVKNLANITTQVEVAVVKQDIVSKPEVNIEEIKPVIIQEDIKDMRSKTADSNKPSERSNKEPEKDFSSDSLVQHVHNLENPSDDKQSLISAGTDDPMENKLEREYRRIFAAKSKSRDTRSSSERPMSSLKSTSTLKRRFEALRRGLAKKEDSKRNSIIVNIVPSQASALSRKDVSINSDPPSLEGRSYSNTKARHPFPRSYSRDKSMHNPRLSHYRRSVTGSKKERNSAQWSLKADDDDSECQGVKGMFKLWGKKFNLEEDQYSKRRPTPKPSYSPTRKASVEKTVETPLVIKPDAEEKKEARKFFFFKKKHRGKGEKPYKLKTKKGVTAGRCEVKDGLVINIGGGAGGGNNTYVPEKIIKEPEILPEKYSDIVRKAWLKKYLSQAIESRQSVQVRWNNDTYAPSSSTVFELMDNVYKDTGIIFRSRSQVTVHSTYKSYTKHHVNFMHQNIEAWMIPKTFTDRPKFLPVKMTCKSDDERKENMEVRISDQKWFIDKSKAFSHKIEVVLHSKNFRKMSKEESSEYLRIDIPKGFFVDSSSEDNNKRPNNHSSDEEVYKIVEYETGSDLKKDKPIRNNNIGDHKPNNIKVTVSVKESKDCDSRMLETMIKTPPAYRDVVIQASNVYIPKRCDVIGVGIITQRDLRGIRKPILKIQDDYSDDESENNDHNLRSNQKKCEFAESYLQEYYRHWTPLGIDLYSWCVSDSRLKCCSEPSRHSFHSQGDGTKSCPNIFDDFQASIVSTPCGASSCSHCHVHEPMVKEKRNEKCKWFGNFKKKPDMNNKLDPSRRVFPKDSVEVFKRRKIYAASDKSKWASSSSSPGPCPFEPPYCVPSIESKGAQNTMAECPKLMKSCCKPVETKPRKRGCKKHVSLPDCDTMNEMLAKQLTTAVPEGILAFKGQTGGGGGGGCENCGKKGSSNCPKHAKVNPEPLCEIPRAPCRDSCEQMKKAPCASSKVSCEKPPTCPGSLSRMPSCPPTPPVNKKPPSCPPSPPACETPSPCPSTPSCPPTPPKKSPPCPPSPPPCKKPPSCPPTPPQKKKPCPTPPCTRSPTRPSSPPPCKKPPQCKKKPTPPPSCPPSPPAKTKKPPSCPPSPPPCKKPPPCPPSPPPCKKPPPCPPSPPPCRKPSPRCPPSPPPCKKPSPRCPPSPPPCKKPSPRCPPSPPPCKRPSPPCPPSPPPCKKPLPPCKKPSRPHSAPSCPQIPSACPHFPPCTPSPATPRSPPCPPTPPACPHYPPCSPSPPPCYHPPPCRPKGPSCPHSPPCTSPPRSCYFIGKPCPAAPPSCPNSPPMCCAVDPNKCPAIPPPCKKQSNSFCKKFSFFKKKTCPASPPCKPAPCKKNVCKDLSCQPPPPFPSSPSPCKKFSATSCSYGSFHKAPDAPYYYSPIHPCPPEVNNNPQTCNTPPCSLRHPKYKPQFECQEPQQPLYQQQRPSCHQQRSSYQQQRPPCPEPRPPCPEPRYAMPEPRPPCPEPRPPCPEPRYAIPEPRSPCPEPRPLCPEPRYSFPEPQYSCPEPRPSHQRFCDRCRTAPDDFPWPTKNQISNQSSVTSLCETQHAEAYGKCKKSCSMLPKLSCETIPSTKKLACKQSCPNYHGSPRPAYVPQMQCPPPPRPPSPPAEPVMCRSPPDHYSRSKSKMSGLFLKMMPGGNKKKTCSKDCLAWDNAQHEDGCISLNSEEKITIRLKKETPSTEEIREGLNIKVQDEDGMTLFERKDYRLQHAGMEPACCSLQRPSLLGLMYKASEVRRVTTSNSVQAIIDNDCGKELGDNTSEASIANLIEIQFKLKVTQGEKTTEINIANDGDKETYVDEQNNKKEDQINKPPQEVFVMKDNGNERNAPVDHSDPKNDINIRIVIKNFKPKSKKKKSVTVKNGDYCKDFSKQISAKFHTVSTGYSDVLHDDNVFSVHRATVDLTSSVDKSKTHSIKSEEIMSEALTDHGRGILMGSSEQSICRCITDMSEGKSENSELKSVSQKYSVNRETQETLEETDTEKLTDHKYEYTEETDNEKPIKYDTEGTDTDKQFEPKYDTETDTDKRPKYDTFMSTDTDEPDTIPEHDTYIPKPKSIEVIVKPHTKDEKKEMLKQVMEKAHETKTKNKTRMRKLRDMLKVILTSDSSDHDDSKLLKNDLATDVTFASLKPNYFRDSDSMNNYYKTESNAALSEGEINGKINYPTEENNSERSNSVSDVLSSENEPPNTTCMCSTVAERLKLVSRIGEGCGCCCSAKKNVKRNEETSCDLKKDSDYLQLENKTTVFVDAQTQNSRLLTSKVNSTNLSIHKSMRSSFVGSINMENDVKTDSGVINVDDRHLNPMRRPFSPQVHHMKQCDLNRLNRNPILSISDEDKIVLLSEKHNRTSAESTKAKDKKKQCKHTMNMLRASDILQSYETKKAVLEIYTEKTISDEGEHLVAKLPKFVYDRENEIQMNYEAMATNTYKAVCKRNIVMMAINR